MRRNNSRTVGWRRERSAEGQLAERSPTGETETEVHLVEQALGLGLDGLTVHKGDDALHLLGRAERLVRLEVHHARGEDGLVGKALQSRCQQSLTLQGNPARGAHLLKLLELERVLAERDGPALDL